RTAAMRRCVGTGQFEWRPPALRSPPLKLLAVLVGRKATGTVSLSELLDFSGFSIWVNTAIFAASAAVVWIAGTRLVRLVDNLSKRTGMGQGFAGMLLLGGIVSLTEISTV